MKPALNWKELAEITRVLGPELEGLFVDRVFIPARPEFPQGFLKGEWALKLSSRSRSAVFYFSVRPQSAYLGLFEGAGPKVSPQGTRSALDLALAKHLKGAKLLEVSCLDRERIVVLWFSASGAGYQISRLGLVLLLLPARPEALLVEEQKAGWTILASSRPADRRAEAGERFVPPQGNSAPSQVELRPELWPELPKDSLALSRMIERNLRNEAFALRLKAVERQLKDLLKDSRTRLRQAEVALQEAQSEPDWQRYGDLLKAHLPEPPSPQDGVRRVLDYASGDEMAIPSDPKLSPREQVEKFFQQARRKQRRLEEANLRATDFRSKAARWEKMLQAAQNLDENEMPDWPSLLRMESELGITPALAQESTAEKKAKKQRTLWPGKSFVSKDRLRIWVGRSKEENLELTFKCARGNDLWLHVRGKPGAHVIVPLPPGKSAPLETLLDAATLAVHYSGGQNWGKTEVDYTFKKHVRRIKESSEASYTHNKTLVVAPEKARLTRLFSEGDSKA